MGTLEFASTIVHMLQRSHVTGGKIHNVNVITDTSAVSSVIRGVCVN